MARQGLQKLYADFRQGWVDTASDLQQPEGTVKDIVNFDINLDGSLIKRSGLKVSGEGRVYSTLIGQREGLQFYLWENVDRDVDRKFLVVVVKGVCNFYDVSHGNVDLSLDKRIASISLPLRSTSIKPKPFSFAESMGKLFFASNSRAVGYFEYNEEYRKIFYKTFNLRMRDTFLWEGEDDVETGIEWAYTGQISPQRSYNLRNSGWPSYVSDVLKEKDSEDVEGYGGSPINYYRNKLGRWPKLSESFYLSSNGAGSTVEEQMAFNPWNFTLDSGGSGTPALGRFIVDIDDFVRSDEGTRYVHYSMEEAPSTIAFYAGRIWYAGNFSYKVKESSGDVSLEVPLAEGNIYFSQDIRTNIKNAEKCYQENDPTAEDINQLLATDGGVFNIKNLGDVKGMVPLSTSLFILSDKGIWRVAGTDFNTFTADSYTIDMVSSEGVTSTDSYVVADNAIYYFSEEGLFYISAEGDLGAINYENISNAKIKNFVEQLPEKTVSNMKISYNKKKGIISCFFAIPTEDTVDNFDYSGGYNTILNYNITLGAFYKYSINTEDLKIVGAIDGLYTQAIPDLDIFVDSLEEAYVDSNDNLYYLPGQVSYKPNDITLIVFVHDTADNVLYPCKFTDNINFEDLGYSYKAEVDIGFDTAGDFINFKKQAPYLAAYLDNSVFTEWLNVPYVPDETIYPSVENSPNMNVDHDYRMILVGDYEGYGDGTSDRRLHFLDGDGEELPNPFESVEGRPIMCPRFTRDGAAVYAMMLEDSSSTVKYTIVELNKDKDNTPKVLFTHGLSVSTPHFFDSPDGRFLHGGHSFFVEIESFLYDRLTGTLTDLLNTQGYAVSGAGLLNKAGVVVTREENNPLENYYLSIKNLETLETMASLASYESVQDTRSTEDGKGLLFTHIKSPSGEINQIRQVAWATIDEEEDSVSINSTLGYTSYDFVQPLGNNHVAAISNWKSYLTNGDMTTVDIYSKSLNSPIWSFELEGKYTGFTFKNPLYTVPLRKEGSSLVGDNPSIVTYVFEQDPDSPEEINFVRKTSRNSLDWDGDSSSFINNWPYDFATDGAVGYYEFELAGDDSRLIIQDKEGSALYSGWGTAIGSHSASNYTPLIAYSEKYGDITVMKTNGDPIFEFTRTGPSLDSTVIHLL